MESESGPWIVNHFAKSNPIGDGQDDVPKLLRAMADELEVLGSIDVQDLVFHSDLTEDGKDWPSLTVYFHRNLKNGVNDQASE